MNMGREGIFTLLKMGQRKISGGMHEVEGLAKARGLAVVFDHTAPTFYRVSLEDGRKLIKKIKVQASLLRPS